MSAPVGVEAMPGLRSELFEIVHRDEAEMVSIEPNEAAAILRALAQHPAAVDESRAMKLWDEFREAGNHEHDALTFVLRALAADQGGDT